MKQRTHTLSVIARSGSLGLLVFLALASISQSARLGSVTVWERLQAAASTRTDLDEFTPSMYHIAKAKSDGHPSHRHLFLAGTEYILLAACDHDCTDLDLAVRIREEDRTIVEDTGEQPVGGVTFTPPETGMYEIEIHVAECSAAFCYYGYSLYRESNPAESPFTSE